MKMAISMHSHMFRCRSISPWPMFAPAGGGAGAVGRRMNLAMSSAMMRPGTPDRKKAQRQSKVDAMAQVKESAEATSPIY